MANWSRDKVDASNLNNGQEYTIDDDVSIEQLNSMVNSGLYSQDFVQALVDAPIIEDDGVSSQPSVEFVDNVKDGKIYKKFKFKNLAASYGTPSGSLPIGMIIPSAIVQDNPAFHLLDGGTIPSTGIYAAFYNFIKANQNKVRAITEEEYTQELQTYQQCGAFVIGADYIRLPKITKFIQGLNDLASLSDIGFTELDSIKSHAHDYTSYKYTSTGTDWGLKGSGTQGDTNTREIQTSTYTGDRETKPKNVRYPYYIVVATAMKTDIEINLENYGNELNSKANKDLSNVTYPENTAGSTTTGSGDRVIETYISSDKNTWYRKWASGWKECGFTFITNTQGIKQFPITFTQQPTCIATLGRPASETIWAPDGNAGVVTVSMGTPYDSAYVWCGTSSSGTCCRLYCCGY